MAIGSSPATARTASAGVRGRLDGSLRLAVGGTLAVGVLAYVVSVLVGAIPASQRLGATELAVIVVGAAGISFLIWPQLLEHVQRIRLGTLEFELHAIQRDQEIQRRELADLRLALLVTLTDAERQHLINLATTPGPLEYRGNNGVRLELRRLRALGLITSRRYIADIRDGQTFNLHDFVELTLRGRDYLARINDETGST